MQRQKPAAIDRAAVLRFMGAAGWQPDAATDALLAQAERQVMAAAVPRAVWRVLPKAAFLPPECGRDLERHLAGCDDVLLLAATLGGEVDRLLRRFELTDIALAAAADALASSLLEQVCDALEEELRAGLRQKGRYLTGRFAPGYGDCPLELNDALCLAVDSARGCGVAVTAQHLLAPRKSTTALLGVAGRPVKGAPAGCGTCHLRETCCFRRRGTTCFSPPDGERK